MHSDIASKIWAESFDPSADYATAEARHDLDQKLRGKLSSIAPRTLQAHVRDVLQQRRKAAFYPDYLDLEQRIARIERALGIDAF